MDVIVDLSVPLSKVALLVFALAIAREISEMGLALASSPAVPLVCGRGAPGDPA